MNLLRYLASWLSRSMDDVAMAALSILGVFRRTKKFQIVEQEGGGFRVQTQRGRSAQSALGETLRFVDGRFVGDSASSMRSRLAGAEIDIVLAARRFIFRSLELPGQASGFLDAIVRAQIDKLTPWNLAQAAFGCGAPTELSGGRVGITVAATARSSVMPLVTALESLEPESIVVSAALDDAEEKPQSRIVVLAQQMHRQRRLRRLRQILVAGPASAGLAAVSALAAWAYVGADLEASRLLISRQLAERRVALLNGRGGGAEEAAAALAQRKRKMAASVIVLESLSKALPDDTYLTELQVADGKLQISGLTHEAASLIAIIEQTDQFKQATFFAPTTRAPVEGAEQFHIEAQIAPFFPAVR